MGDFALSKEGKLSETSYAHTYLALMLIMGGECGRIVCPWVWMMGCVRDGWTEGRGRAKGMGT